MGQVGRLVLDGVKKTGIPYTAISSSSFLSRRDHPFQTVGRPFAFETNLLCVNADQVLGVVRDFGKEALENHYNIGVWWWEVDAMPGSMAAASQLLDEIWVGSEHVGRAVVPSAHKLVRLMPMPILPVEAEPLERKLLALPDAFMFLFTFDFLSIFERKNPLAVLEAFKMAFAPKEGPLLLIKSINGEQFPDQLERLKTAADGRTDIRIMDGYFSKRDQDGLLAACDCYVSLHRAEGYGLGLAEAASLGKPIIATGYSGCLSFLNPNNSFLVDYRLVNVGEGAGPYPEQAQWAEPDIDDAAEKMRRVYFEPEEAKARGHRARWDVKEIHTLQRTADFIRRRLEDIRLTRAAAALAVKE